MHCLSCDKVMTDYEATRRYESSGEFIDLCNGCFHKSDVPSLNIIDRPDLAVNIIEEEIENEDDS